MRLASSSFFHYTNDINAVKSILTHGFNIYYCKEDIYSADEPHHLGIPMVSFCDVPLSFISDNNYGKYAIGMQRKWGIHKKLQPVMYYPNNRECLSTRIIIRATENVENDESPDSYVILGCSKPMYKINKGSDSSISANNYIEREWRRVLYPNKPHKWLLDNKYDVFREAQGANKQPISALTFAHYDIDFLIIPQNDIEELIDYILDNHNQHFGGITTATISEKDRHKLISKIVAYENLVRNI